MKKSSRKFDITNPFSKGITYMQYCTYIALLVDHRADSLVPHCNPFIVNNARIQRIVTALRT